VTRVEQRLLLATGLVLLLGSVLFVLMGGLSKVAPVAPAATPGPDAGPVDPPGASKPPRPLASDGPLPSGAQVPAGMTDLSPGGSGLRPGLREPFGDELSSPAKVKELLRQHLAAENVRWDYVAKLLAVLRDPLDADVKAAIQAALEHGNAAGAIQAYQACHDGTVVAGLLKLLDDPAAEAHDHANVLAALSMIPGANASEVVTGIESRLSGDLARDKVYLQAIARTGGVEAARALVDAIARAKDPLAIDDDVFRELDFKKSPDAADHVAGVLHTTTLSPEALAAVVELAGRPGASRALVDALLALDADTTPASVRKHVVASLAATSDDAAIERLLVIATKGADYASVAARALGDVTSASPASRGRLLETAKTTTDENLKARTIHALGGLREVAAVPFLTESLESAAPEVLTESVIALGRVGKASAPAVSRLSRVYEGGDEALRQHVAISLGSIGTDEALSLLKQLQTIEKSDKVKTSLGGAIRAVEARGSSSR